MTILSKSVSVGSDPEIIVSTDNEKLSPIDVIDLIGGSKTKPRKVTNGFVQEDGVLLEMNPNPAYTKEEFIRNTVLLLEECKEILQELDLYPSMYTAAIYPEETFNKIEALIAGCDPDYDAWTGRINKPPSIHLTKVRAAAGHIQIGFESNDPEDKIKLVKVLDLTLASQIAQYLPIEDQVRKHLYGRSGAYRDKSVRNGDPFDGIEYRVLGNVWIFSTAMMEFIWDTIMYSIENLEMLYKKATSLRTQIRNSINSPFNHKLTLFKNPFLNGEVIEYLLSLPSIVERTIEEDKEVQDTFKKFKEIYYSTATTTTTGIDLPEAVWNIETDVFNENTTHLVEEDTVHMDNDDLMP